MPRNAYWCRWSRVAPLRLGGYAQCWPGSPAEGPLTVELEIAHARVAASPMEPRGTASSWSDGRLTVWLGTQTPHRAQAELACMLGLPAAQIRVVAPDVGGVRRQGIDLP